MTTVEGISEPESGVLALEGIRTRSVGATPPRYPSASSSAGSGSRLGVLAKPLACVVGLALLERAVATFCSRGLEQIVVVVGHGSASVREFVARRGLDVELVHAGGGRPTEAFAAFCGQLSVGWHFLAPSDPEAKRAVERLQGFMETSFEPGRSFAGPFGYPGQIATRGTRRKATYWSALRGDSFGRWQRR
jgi:hypothetical protein